MILDNDGVIKGLKEYKEKWDRYQYMKERLFGAQMLEPIALDKDDNIIYENQTMRHLEEETEKAMDYFSTLHEAFGGVDIPNQTAIIGVYIYGRDKEEIAKKINVEVSEIDGVLAKGIEMLKNELLEKELNKEK